MITIEDDVELPKLKSQKEDHVVIVPVSINEYPELPEPIIKEEEPTNPPSPTGNV